MYWNLINPWYLYRRRERIIPTLEFQIRKQLSGRGFVISRNDRILAGLRDKEKGKRAFIIGNGPSLNVKDLDRLKGEVTFASNKIYLAFEETDWRPTYYGVEDGLVAQQNFAAIKAINGFQKFFPTRLKMIVPKFEDGIYFNLHWQEFFPSRPGFGVNPLETFYWGSTITYTHLQFAFYLGIQEVFLLGVDFSFEVPKKEKGDGEGENVLVSKGEVNHFHPEYRKPGEKWFVPNLHVQEKSFEAAKEFYNASGRTIYNATRGGKLEIFPRIDFDSLVYQD